MWPPSSSFYVCVALSLSSCPVKVLRMSSVVKFCDFHDRCASVPQMEFHKLGFLNVFPHTFSSVILCMVI